MSEQPIPPPDDMPPFDPTLLDVQPVDMPASEDQPAPDHTASQDEKVSPIDRVRRARDAREKSKPATKRTATKKAKPRATRAGELVGPLTEIYTTIGVVMSPFDPACATALLTNAERCAKSLDELARQNDSVRRALLALTQTSAWGGVFAAHLPLLLMVATHHAPKNVAELTAPLAMVNAPEAMERLIAEQTAKMNNAAPEATA